eukprot:TRINITY_DN25492_c0_g1_i1.p1 TRINITY_DN25492_c0_g1~~TRINITY_DN25492_c0_g1_i1.p1  ORF type:complete len:612 (-),score=83.27 TRINITY_DN25492_c0_g1_i1:87-1922(-)
MTSAGTVAPQESAKETPIAGRKLAGRRQLPLLQLDFKERLRQPAISGSGSGASNSRDGHTLDTFRSSYTLNEIIGSGTTSVVRRCTRKDGQRFAVKCTTAVDDEVRQFTRDEYELVRSLRHPAIIQFRAFFEGPASTLIVMDFCNDGSLEQLVKEQGVMTELLSQHLACQLFRGVNYMHHKRVVHRDLKPANLLLHRPSTSPGAGALSEGSGTYQLKISDFNSASRVGKGQSLLLTDRGTQTYTAPELRFGRLWNERIDIWACGLCVFFSLEGCIPFDITQQQVAESLMSGSLPRINWANMSPTAGNLIRQCLILEPTDRPTAMELLLHPFINIGLKLSGNSSANSPVARGASLDTMREFWALIKHPAKDSMSSRSPVGSEFSEPEQRAFLERVSVLRSCGLLVIGSSCMSHHAAQGRRGAIWLETEEQLQRSLAAKQSSSPGPNIFRPQRSPLFLHNRSFAGPPGQDSGSSHLRSSNMYPSAFETASASRRSYSMYTETPTTGDKFPTSPQRFANRREAHWKEPRSFDVLLRAANQRYRNTDEELRGERDRFEELGDWAGECDSPLSARSENQGYGPSGDAAFGSLDLGAPALDPEQQFQNLLTSFDPPS